MEKPNSPGRGSDRIKLNVGGRVFETTVSTAQSGGPDSLLATLSSTRHHQQPIFIDRDPEMFSVLLSVLRSSRLPSSSSSPFSLQDLLLESSFYGLESQLRSSLSPPPLSGLDASLSHTLLPSSDPFVSSLSVSDHHPLLLVAHSGQISSYDPLLLLPHSSSPTLRTHLHLISSLSPLSSSLAAVGSHSSPGLHLYDTSSSLLLSSTYWTDPSDPRIYKSTVSALSHSPPDSPLTFASFHCRHGENAVLSLDKSTLKIASEFGRHSGNSSKYEAPTKLIWMPSLNLVVGSSVTSGAFGCAGYIRMWDPRSGEMVWETTEPGSGRSSRFGDAMADADVDIDGERVVKVCSKSGDVGVADMRGLREDPWVYLEDPNSNSTRTGRDAYGRSVVKCYKGQVFVGTAEGLEVWSRVGGGEYRRNYVDKAEDTERGPITRIEAGGERLFVCRDNVEGIQVWETSHHSGLVPLNT